MQWSMQTHSDLFHYDRHDQHKSDESVTTEEIDMSKVCWLCPNRSPMSRIYVYLIA